MVEPSKIKGGFPWFLAVLSVLFWVGQLTLALIIIPVYIRMFKEAGAEFPVFTGVVFAFLDYRSLPFFLWQGVLLLVLGGLLVGSYALRQHRLARIWIGCATVLFICICLALLCRAFYMPMDYSMK